MALFASSTYLEDSVEERDDEPDEGSNDRRVPVSDRHDAAEHDAAETLEELGVVADGAVLAEEDPGDEEIGGRGGREGARGARGGEGGEGGERGEGGVLVA